MPTSVSTRSPGTLNPTRQQLDELDALLKRMLELPVKQLNDSDEAEVEDVAEEPASPPPPIPQYTRESKREALEPKSARPVSYMVVETASPRPLPAASGFETRPSVLTPREAPVPPPREELFEEEPPAPVETPEPAPPMESSSNEAEVWVPLRSTWQPSAQTWQPLADSWQQANGATPPPAPMVNPIPSPRLAAEPTAPTAPTAPDPIESVQRLSAMVAQASWPSQDIAGETPLPAAPTPIEPRLSLSAEDAPVSPPLVLMPLVWFNQGFDACVAPLGEPGRWLSSSRGRQTLGIVGFVCLVAATAIALSAGMGWTW